MTELDEKKEVLNPWLNGGRIDHWVGNKRLYYGKNECLVAQKDGWT